MWTEIFILGSLGINILPGVSRALLCSKCCFTHGVSEGVLDDQQPGKVCWLGVYSNYMGKLSVKELGYRQECSAYGLVHTDPKSES